MYSKEKGWRERERERGREGEGDGREMQDLATLATSSVVSVNPYCVDSCFTPAGVICSQSSTVCSSLRQLMIINCCCAYPGQAAVVVFVFVSP